MERLKNARLWIWWREGWVKITVPVGDNIELHYHGRHEEGWSSHHECWSNDGKEVIWEVSDRGSDCDGRHGSDAEFVCSIDKLATLPIMRMIQTKPYEQSMEDTGLFQPEWERTDSRVYDQYAQLSNY